jgi:hypothetical protein
MKKYIGDGSQTKFEPPQKKLFFDYSIPQARVKDMGLCWDSVGIDQVDDDLFRLGLDQGQANNVVILHALQVKRIFTPKNYSWKARFFIAAFFLMPRFFGPKSLRN